MSFCRLLTLGAAIVLASSQTTGARSQRQRPLAVSFAPSVIRSGDVALVEVVASRDDVFTASVFDRPLLFEYDEEARRWRALLGVDLDTKPGTYPLHIVRRAGATVRSLKIVARRFRVRHLRVSPEFVDPPEAAVQQIKRDAERLAAIYARRTRRAWSDPFVRPVDGPASSNFGTRSYYNGARRSPHAGVDFAGETGTPVRASNAGTVAHAGAMYFTGNTVIIDHGAGLFSVFAHLSEINTAEGEPVRPDTIIGLVGATGRVTAPHLHWSVRLDGARVDPLSLMETSRRW